MRDGPNIGNWAVILAIMAKNGYTGNNGRPFLWKGCGKMSLGPEF